MRDIWLLSIIAASFLVACSTSPEPRLEVEPGDDPESSPEATEEVYEIGDEGPAGGVVFYVDDANAYGWTYLEAAPWGWYDGGADPAIAWGDTGVAVGASGGELGQGLANTEAALAHSEDYSAGLVTRATINGYDDWHLPSQDEMYHLYENLVRNDLGQLAQESYWTSTERNEDRAMAYGIGTGGRISAMKHHEYKIRPIRAF